MEYTIEQCKEDMIYMWGWLADHDYAGKDDFMGWLRNTDQEKYDRFSRLLFTCPCCHLVGFREKTSTIFSNHPNCEKCPIVWQDNKYEGSPICLKRGNEYWVWDKTHTSEVAEVILNLAKKINIGLCRNS